ncbi:MAG: FAD-dependent monooxygenase [Saprospiraceae bacterium]|nr:FAD-dependent monooxygenase [Saprospiraceae bacterium]MDW8229415.1 FAD-dependent monooxygenase [Saprospiraceae bacterium]
MATLTEIALLPQERYDPERLRQKAAEALGISPAQIGHLEVLKASLDARGREPVYRLRIAVYAPDEVFVPEPAVLSGFRPVSEHAPRVLIVGAGPAGYFAALELLERGLRPIVLDRGKDARARRRDLRAIQQLGVVNPHSNYCFGEGGAGTYSDGKLYTRSVKRGDWRKVLRLLVEHGAKSDILVEAHPHIGSNKLPGVVQNLRATIEQYGGEVHFGQWMTDLLLRDGRAVGVVTQEITDVGPGPVREWLADAVVLATGHSARDVYRLLHARGLRLEAKPFALGVRVEHRQALVDAVQYHRPERGEHLPAASYSLTCQVRERGVFSFCMCPGGLIVPAATAPGEIVTNGMSMSRRDSPFANSGVVTAIEAADLKPWQRHGVFAHMAFQAEVEQRMFNAGDGSQRAPALRLTDFVAGRLSADLPASSYIPGLFVAPLYELLPPFVYQRLREGLKQFGRLFRGYLTAEAVVVATESRTSAPIRIPRDAHTLMHPDAAFLYPCGEGAGYAGGILSAAMDGQRVAQAIAAALKG